MMRKAAVVLCGGESRRMGLPKATLPFGPETMLARIVRTVRQSVSAVAVVAAPRQGLPPLPAGVIVARDRRGGRGPLEGLAAGLRAVGQQADAVYATSCDVPLLQIAFVDRLFALLGDHQIVVPKDGKFHHPLAAVYRTSVLPHVEQLLDEDRLRPVFLFESVATLRVPIKQLRNVDPALSSLRNLNEPRDYLRALSDAGLDADPDVLKKLRLTGTR